MRRVYGSKQSSSRLCRPPSALKYQTLIVITRSRPESLLKRITRRRTWRKSMTHLRVVASKSRCLRSETSRKSTSPRKRNHTVLIEMSSKLRHNRLRNTPIMVTLISRRTTMKRMIWATIVTKMSLSMWKSTRWYQTHLTITSKKSTTNNIFRSLTSKRGLHRKSKPGRRHQGDNWIDQIRGTRHYHPSLRRYTRNNLRRTSQGHSTQLNDSQLKLTMSSSVTTLNI